MALESKWSCWYLRFTRHGLHVDSSPSHKPDWFRENIERWLLSGKHYMSRSKQRMRWDQRKDFKDQIWRCQRKVFQQKSGWVNIYYRIVQSSKITWAETLVERVFVLARFNTIKQESCHRRDVYAYLWLPSWIQINIQKKNVVGRQAASMTLTVKIDCSEQTIILLVLMQ